MSPEPGVIHTSKVKAAMEFDHPFYIRTRFPAEVRARIFEYLLPRTSKEQKLTQFTLRFVKSCPNYALVVKVVSFSPRNTTRLSRNAKPVMRSFATLSTRPRYFSLL